ncbi:molybdate ABC transporter substrate-binding protein [Phosphitispora sp. TUW77]|uniref:molybdate ABC transporter substrate-binding protein n=1 Tax=Phosphitispora sp. TUW77 TaxID=3152361 RepID=UPI003AB4CB42
MRKVRGLLFVLLITALFIIGCNSAGQMSDNSDTNVNKEEIMVSAAMSLKDVLTETQVLYEEKNPGVKLNINFGASGTLQHQIEQGAPADLFISAGKKQMDELENNNLIIKETRVDLVGNELVMVVDKANKNIKDLQDLTGPEISRISIGTPETVPAGKYAQESLKFLNLWDAVQPKLVLAKDVRQVLAYVETGNVEAGLVYGSDAGISDKLRIAAVAPSSSHRQIVYPAALIQNSNNKNAAQKYLDFLGTKEAHEIFTKFGFKILK